MRILGAETEQKIHALEAARAWRRSGLISNEQLARLQESLGPLPTQAGWAIRGLFWLCALIAVSAWQWILFFSEDDKTALSVAAALSAGACYYIAERLIRTRRLYRFGVEEGFLAAALGQVLLAIGLLLPPHLELPEATLLIGLPVALACSWIYLRFGYMSGAYGALVAISVVVVGQMGSWSTLSIRGAMAALYATLLAVAACRRDISDHDRLGWQSLQAFLFLMICLLLNVRLEHLPDLSRTIPPDGGLVYWASLAAIFLLPALGLRVALRQRDRPLLGSAAIAVLVALASVKPYLGLVRHAWDTAVLGTCLMGLSIWLKRWLDAGPEGRREGFTARSLVVSRENDSPLTGLLAAASAAGATSLPPHKGFSGHGGSSGGAGAGGQF